MNVQVAAQVFVLRRNLTSLLWSVAVLIGMAATLSAQTTAINFSEFNDGLHNDVNLAPNQVVQGLPAGVTATWNSFNLYPVAAPSGSPMGIYSWGSSSVIFSAPVMVSSLLVAHPQWAGPCSIIGKRAGQSVWRYDYPAGQTWWQPAVTAGANLPIDELDLSG